MFLGESVVAQAWSFSNDIHGLAVVLLLLLEEVHASIFLLLESPPELVSCRLIRDSTSLIMEKKFSKLHFERILK